MATEHLVVVSFIFNKKPVMGRLLYNTVFCAGRYLASPLRHPPFNFFSLSQRRKIATVPMSQPRVFPDSGFYRLDSTARFEEETLPGYLEERYYPVHIGEVFKSRYQVITKLGFGSSSTVWLCRDLQYVCKISNQVSEISTDLSKVIGVIWS